MRRLEDSLVDAVDGVSSLLDEYMSYLLPLAKCKRGNPSDHGIHMHPIRLE